MTKERVALLFVNDFADRGEERFYLSSGNKIAEASAEDIVRHEGEMICHDYWLIAPALYRRTRRLPTTVIDVEELRISTSGKREDRENRDRIDVSLALRDYISPETIGRYRNIIFKNSAFDHDTFAVVGEALIKLCEAIEAQAKLSNEWQRYTTIERPVTEYLIKAAADGITIDSIALQKHKKDIDFSYYMALKDFSAKYSLPLEVPSEEEIIEYLSPKGFDFSGVGVDYVLNFVPMADGFSDRLLDLRKIATSRMVLDAIPLSQKKIYPIVDSFGSITSRIYYRDPSLQNLSKRHRDIIIPDSGKKLSYVDFGQFEAGIMGALSGDERMLSLFSAGDLYSTVAESIFQTTSKRKAAKRLFLSYAYGMKRKSLIQAAVEFGAQRQVAKDFFNQFSRFETWKSEVWSEFQSKGRVGTSFGNFLSRVGHEALTEREKRSAVSQVVQGTASLIFKKALIELSLITDVELKVPMHDAVLFQHPERFQPEEVATLFASVMTRHFEGRITGKASVATFVQDYS